MRVGLLEKIAAFLAEHPALQGVILAVMLAAIRVWREGKKDWLEAFTCALLTIGAIPLLGWLSVPAGVIVFVGVVIGHIGSRRIRTIMDKFLGAKAGAGSL